MNLFRALQGYYYLDGIQYRQQQRMRLQRQEQIREQIRQQKELEKLQKEDPQAYQQYCLELEQYEKDMAIQAVKDKEIARVAKQKDWVLGFGMVFGFFCILYLLLHSC